MERERTCPWVEAAARPRAGLERMGAVRVRRARTQGATWAKIAALLGVGEQAVRKEYGGCREEDRRSPPEARGAPNRRIGGARRSKRTDPGLLR